MNVNAAAPYAANSGKRPKVLLRFLKRGKLEPRFYVTGLLFLVLITVELTL